MNWARNHKISMFLSFWMLWSTVGIKLYLEYCACHEAIQASLFMPDDESCPTGVFAIVNFPEEEDAEHQHACCSPEKLPVAPEPSCCKSDSTIPSCPPEGCDSHDVQEYKVTTPFLLSGQDLPVFAVAITRISPLLLVPEHHYAEESLNDIPFHSSPHPTGRQCRIAFQSFLC